MRQFDWDRFKNGNEIVVRCRTEEEANDFCKQMHEHGMCWASNVSYLEKTLWDTHEDRTCYAGRGTYSSTIYYQEAGYKILEWSDYMKESFTKKDLKDGMIVELRSGDKYLVLKDRFVGFDGSNDFEEYDDNLIAISEDNDKADHEYDIVSVYELDTRDYPSINNILEKDEYLKLLWKRDEVKRMTSEEMKKELEKLKGEKIEVEPSRDEMIGVCYSHCVITSNYCRVCEFDNLESCSFARFGDEELKECYEKVMKHERENC